MRLRSDWEQRTSKHFLRSETAVDSSSSDKNKIEAKSTHVMAEELEMQSNHVIVGKEETHSNHAIAEEVTMESDYSSVGEQSSGGEFKTKSSNSIRSEIEAAISNLK